MSIDIVAGVVALVLAIVWLVRLEGRLNGIASTKAESSALQTVAANVESVKATVDNAKSDIDGLQIKATASEETKIEVVRLQEQIKHLTNLIEKWLQPAAPSPAPPRQPTRRRAGEDG